MSASAVWPTLTRDDVADLSQFTNTVQWTLIAHSCAYVLIAAVIYVSLVVMDRCTAQISYNRPTIKLDVKGFSANELRLYSLPHVPDMDGCKLNALAKNDNGNLKTPPMDGTTPISPVYLDPVVRPLLDSVNTTPQLLFLRWDVCTDFQNNEDDQAEAAEMANTGTPSERDRLQKDIPDEKSPKKSVIVKDSTVNPVSINNTVSKEPFGTSKEHEIPAESKKVLTESNEIAAKSKETPLAIQANNPAPVVPSSTASKEKSGSKESKKSSKKETVKVEQKSG